jgi:uncharacterized protein YqhQ
MKKDKKNKENNTPAVRICSVGGEALMEGIMMRAPGGFSQVIRNPEGNLDVEIKMQKPLSKKNKFFGIPVIRGFVALVDSLSTGMKCLFRSAETSGLEEEIPEEEMSKFDKFLTKKLGDKLPQVIMTFSLLLAVALSVGLFFLLPNVLASLIIKKEQSIVLYNLIEGVVRILIFLSYMFLVSRMKDIKRVFMYHGAEHKTIHCFEHMDELTIENVRKYSKHHPRCGTAFMFVVMVISILIYSLLPRFDFFLYNILLRIITLPLIAGIGYEFNRFCGKYENTFTKILRAPGMALQRLTTFEPDDDMITVAIVALNKALALDTADGQSPSEHYILDPDGNPLPEPVSEETATVENPA